MALGYVNDAAYAQALVERRLRQGRGRQLISRELDHKGLGDEVVVGVIASVDTEAELKSAISLADKLVRRHAAEPPDRARQKVLAALGRRGFPASVCRRALEAAIQDSSV